MTRDELSAGWEEVYDDLDVPTEMDRSFDQDDSAPDYSALIADDDEDSSGFRVRPDWMGRGTYASEYGEFAPYW